MLLSDLFMFVLPCRSSIGLVRTGSVKAEAWNLYALPSWRARGKGGTDGDIRGLGTGCGPDTRAGLGGCPAPRCSIGRRCRASAIAVD